MAIEIERLVARIEGDLSGIRAELSKAGQLTEQATGKMGQAFQNVAPAVRVAENAIRGLKVVLGGYVVKELFQATQRSVEYISTLKDTAGQLNINIERLQSLRFAFDQSGLSGEAADSALRRLSVSIGNAVIEGGEAAQTFERLGVQLTDAAGNTRDTAEVFDDLVAKFATVGSAAERNALAMQLFGRQAGPRMGELLSQGADALSALEAQAQATGAVISKDLADEVEALGDRLSALGTITKTQASAALATALGPAVEGVTYLVAELVTGINETIQGIRVLAGMGADPLDAKIEDVRDSVEALQAAIARGTPDALFGVGVTTVEQANAALKQQQAELQKLKDLQLDLIAAAGQRQAADGPEAPAGGTTFKARDETSQDRLATMVEEQQKELDAVADFNEARIKEVGDAAKKENETREQYVREWYALVDEMRAEDVNSELEYQEQQAKLRDEVAEQDKKRSKDQADFDARMHETRWNAARTALQNLSALMASESRKQFEVGKAAAIAETIVSTYKGAQQAYSALSGIPYVGPALGAAAAIAAIAGGLARVSAIKSTTFGSRSVAVGVGGGLAVGSGGAGGGATEGQAPVRNIIVNLPTDTILGADGVRELMRRIGEQTGDGVRLTVG